MSDADLSIVTPEATEAASQAFLGQWHRLVSTTNWEKGRIVSDWRAALAAAGATTAEYSDDVWSRRAGSVSPQHVGRLRRVYERFGTAYASFEGIYWSHFYTALEWHDAEMWLEGAGQNRWSVSEMRAARLEVADPDQERGPTTGEIVTAEYDEDFSDAETGYAHVVDPEPDRSSEMMESGAPAEDIAAVMELPEGATAFDPASAPTTPLARVQPFASLGNLPDDLAEALESFKLAIIRHKLAGWVEVTRDDVLTALDGLRHLALATG